MLPPSAIICAPNKIRQPGPMMTSPQITALGAMYALESILGEMPLCVMIMGVIDWFVTSGRRP